MFVNRFHYSVSEFDLLTPVQAYQILNDAFEIERSRREFLQHEFRNVCYFIIKSSMGDTKQIKTPNDLWKIGDEIVEKKPIKFEITDDDRKIIARLLQQHN